MPVIFVNDIAISKAFYQDIFNLEVEHDFGLNITFKDAISLWQIGRAEEIVYGAVKKGRFEKGVKAVELYFQTDDIEAVYQVLRKKNVELLHELKEEPWGQKTVRFYDPDQFIVEVAEPMEDVVLRFSRSGMSNEDVSKKTQMPLAVVVKIIKHES